MKELLLVLFSTIIFVSQANAQSTLALQEKCAEGAKKFFSENEKARFFHNVGIWTDEGGVGKNRIYESL